MTRTLLFILTLFLALTSSCATIDARFQLADGRWAHVKARRLFTQVNVMVRDDTNNVTIQYGAQSEADKVQQLLSALGPLLSAMKAGAVVPIP